jgi:CheY-like chemotaxis protein
MPIMDGREFLDRIAGEERLKSLPVIVLSATAPSDLLPEKISVIPKPVTGDRLLAQIRASLTMSSSYRVSCQSDLLVKMTVPGGARRMRG